MENPEDFISDDLREIYGMEDKKWHMQNLNSWYNINRSGLNPKFFLLNEISDEKLGKTEKFG